MKITIVQGPYFPVPAINGGAIERVWFGLGKEFARRGHEVSHISRTDPRLPDREIIDGVQHVRIPSRDRLHNMVADNFFDLTYSLQVLPRLPKADILVTNTFWLPVLEKRASRGRHYVHIARFPRRQMRLYRHAARLQPVSNVIRDAIIDQSPSLAPITRTIPNALPHDFKIATGVPAKNPDRFEIVFVGRLHPEKGIDILLDAYHEFLVTATRPVRLRIVGPHARNCGGGGEEYYRGLRERAASLGASLEWCGPAFGAEQLQRFYEEAHVLVYPSIAAKGEASPLTPVEAMASACVPVVSDLKCFADYLTDGVNGFTFSLTPSPSTNLARVLTKASAPETSLVSIQQCCLKTAKEYSLSNVATLYEVDFLEILSSRENLAADSRDLLASRPLHPKS